MIGVGMRVQKVLAGRVIEIAKGSVRRDSEDVGNPN
jgi:hypothetical protein